MSTTTVNGEPKKRLRLSLSTIGAVVGIVTGIIGLVFLLKPDWAPRLGPDEGKAAVTDLRIMKPITFRRYLQIQELPAGSLSQELLRRQGALFQFHYDISGFKGKQLPLRWELSDQATNELVSRDKALTIKPSTNAEGRDWSVWVPVPTTRRKYYVTVTIFQPEGTVPLRAFDSPVFAGLAAPQ